MGYRTPEIEYIPLKKLKIKDNTDKRAYNCLQKLAEKALKNGTYSVTYEKKSPNIAPSKSKHDFLSYSPYWFPVNDKDPNTEYTKIDGKINDSINDVKDQKQLQSLAEDFTFLCLEYFFSKKEEYANHAIDLLNTFFLEGDTKMNPNMNYAAFVRGSQNKTQLGRGEGVVSSRSLCRIVNLLPLLYKASAYNARIKEGINKWFKDYLRWLETNDIALEGRKAENNIRTWYFVQIASIHHFLDSSSEPVKKVIKDFFNSDLDRQIDPKTGNQKYEIKRAKPFHYLAFNMNAMLFLAELAKDIGLENVYSSHPLLHLAINYITKQKITENDDITRAVRCVEIMFNAVKDEDNCCKQFLSIAYKSKNSENIKGPKNTIKLLWSEVPSDAPYLS